MASNRTCLASFIFVFYGLSPVAVAKSFSQKPKECKVTASEENKNQVWTNFIGAMVRGEPSLIQRLSTQKGYDQLLLFKSDDQDLSTFFVQLGKQFESLQMTWGTSSPKEFSGTLGAKIKGSPVRFICKDAQWLFDYWGGPGK